MTDYPGGIFDASLHLSLPKAPNMIAPAVNAKIANIRSVKLSNCPNMATAAANPNPSDATQKPIPRNHVQSFPYFLGVNNIREPCHTVWQLSTHSGH